jgi:diguanylate cyclase (GGDEF)-like protein
MADKVIDIVTKIKPLLVAIGIILVVSIGLIDYYTDYELGLSVFYLIPIFIVSWFGGRNLGIFIAFISAAAWNIMILLAVEESIQTFLSFWNLSIRAALFMGVVFLIFKLKEKLANEQKHSRIDFLTGVGNIKSFYELASSEIRRSRRYSRSFSTVYIDCDDFKKVNDSFGHKRGDELIKLIAWTVQREVRASDIFARIGGDEFIVLLIETTFNSAQKIIQRIRKQLLNEVKRNSFSVTFSFGAATFTNIPETVDRVIQKTDHLMYEAKRQGKDSIIHREITQ